MSVEATEALRQARRTLDDLFPRVSVEDWIWDDSTGEWCLAFTVRLERWNIVPDVSRWIATTSPDYPNGKIRIYPAIDGGIEDTYPHQSNNGLVYHGKYCRSGNICLFTASMEWARQGDASFTLLSHVERLIEWLEKANEGLLANVGDHFEFPMQRIVLNEIVLYFEDEATKRIWDNHSNWLDGTVEAVENDCGHICLSSFYDSRGELIRFVEWGMCSKADKTREPVLGIWFISKSIPHIRCWQSPNTYGELRKWAKAEGLDLDRIIARNSSRLRDGLRHYLAIGVFCPDIVGEHGRVLSWFVAKLPRLADVKEFGPGGVHSPQVLKSVDRHKYLASDRKIHWCRSVNCAKDQMHSRGSLCDRLTDSRIALIGAGSLGSLVADNLVRGGVTNLCIFDSDVFEIGNVTRHVLRACDVGEDKSDALSTHLNAISPAARIEGRSNLEKGDANLLEKYDIIIDCSSSPAVLMCFDEMKGENRLFICSFGYAAENVYFSASTLGLFSSSAYWETFGEMLRADASRINTEELPWEGTGCWSPVFPAKNADVSRAASLVVDCVNQMMENEQCGINLAYVTRRDGNGVMLGIDRIEL